MEVSHDHNNYFTGKFSLLPTNLWKTQNFSTSNNLQYTISDQPHCSWTKLLHFWQQGWVLLMELWLHLILLLMDEWSSHMHVERLQFYFYNYVVTAKGINQGGFKRCAAIVDYCLLQSVVLPLNRLFVFRLGNKNESSLWAQAISYHTEVYVKSSHSKVGHQK